MVVNFYLVALHTADERMADLAFKIYFVTNTEFLTRTFVPLAKLSYRYCMIDVVFELLAQLLKVISGGMEGFHRTVEPSSFRRFLLLLKLKPNLEVINQWSEF